MREDWIEIELGKVCLKADKVNRNQMPPNDYFFYIDIASIDNKSNIIIDHKSYKWGDAPSRAQQIVKLGDVLFSTVRTYLKNIAQVNNPQFDDHICSSGFTVIRGKKEVLNQNYAFYFSIYEGFLQPLNELQTGTSYPAVRDKDVFSQKIPLAPLPEQRAIVSKIEQLFSELNNGIANLKSAKEKLEVYRQAVLKKAFEPLSKSVILGEISEVKRGKSKHRPRNDNSLFGGKYPFIQTGEIRAANGGIINTFKLTYSEKGLSQSKLWPKGTLCLTIAANIGETAFLGFDACFPDSVVGINPIEEKLDKKYLNFYIQKIKIELDSQASATAQKNINVKFLENLQIPLPNNVMEQISISQKIEHQFSVCDKLAENINESLEKSEALRQSILKKAFSGELLIEKELETCKQEADWEPAEKLLERFKNK